METMSQTAKGDGMMRKASELFLRQKYEKAYDKYAEAVRWYSSLFDPPRPKVALAWYTRAYLVLEDNTPGDAIEDVVAGEAIVAGIVDGADAVHCRRFDGLFRYLRARIARQIDEDFARAHNLLAEAEDVLSRWGQPFDLYEVERERARLHADEGHLEKAESSARKAVDRAASPNQLVFARILLAEIYQLRDDIPAVVRTLDQARGTAWDHRLVHEGRIVTDRMKALLAARPELKEQPEVQGWI